MSRREATEQEDPGITAVKYIAFSRAQRRVRTKTEMVTLALAMPPALVVWFTNAHLWLLNQLGFAGGQERLVFVTHVALAGWALMLTHAALFPVRWHLRSRWRVEPERFGLASTNGSGESD